MPDVVLVVLEEPGAAPALLHAAGRLACLLGRGRVEALAVEVPAEGTIMPTEEVLTARRMQDWETAEHARLEALHRAFVRWRENGDESARQGAWRVETGDPEQVVAAHGRRADYVVIAQPGESGGPPVREIVHTALFETSRPVLVVPPGFRGDFGQEVAIAWKDDGRAQKAILAAMPLLGAADRIRVFAGARPGAPEPGLPDILTEHAVPAVLHAMPVGERGTFGAALLDEVRIAGADLLVMGAYAHGAWWDMLIGGVTRRVLAAAAIPVLMRH